jgi:hypothetical protein
VHHRNNEPCITTRIPRQELVALLGRSVRGEKDEVAANEAALATPDRAAPIVVHRGPIAAWLARRALVVGEGASRPGT